ELFDHPGQPAAAALEQTDAELREQVEDAATDKRAHRIHPSQAVIEGVRRVHPRREGGPVRSSMNPDGHVELLSSLEEWMQEWVVEHCPVGHCARDENA